MPSCKTPFLAILWIMCICMLSKNKCQIQRSFYPIHVIFNVYKCLGKYWVSTVDCIRLLKICIEYGLQEPKQFWTISKKMFARCSNTWPHWLVETLNRHNPSSLLKSRMEQIKTVQINQPICSIKSCLFVLFEKKIFCGTNASNHDHDIISYSLRNTFN